MLGLVSLGSEAYHMVRVNTRGELNHTERSHYFLKHLLKQYFTICTAYQNTSHLKHQTQVLQTPLKHKKINEHIIRNDNISINNILLSFMQNIIINIIIILIN